ncbi:hypothetical protein [Streptomyces lasiicapitis]
MQGFQFLQGLLDRLRSALVGGERQDAQQHTLDTGEPTALSCLPRGFF